MKDQPECQHPRILGGPNCDCMRPMEEQTKEMPIPIFLRIAQATGERRALEGLMQTAKKTKIIPNVTWRMPYRPADRQTKWGVLNFPVPTLGDTLV